MNASHKRSTVGSLQEDKSLLINMNEEDTRAKLGGFEAHFKEVKGYLVKGYVKISKM